MATATAQITSEEIIRRGKEIYERDIRPLVEAGNEGCVVAIDVISGEYELADNATASAGQLRARLPEAEVFFMRVGYPTMARIL